MICILTIIKDEQEYLEEWIKYHLNLGINHIFILEDSNSTSHRYITDKFENVSLKPITELYKDERKQSEYVKAGLLYIKENYNYDWCFSIDIDEYITPDGDIHEIMQQFDDYDAVVLHWQNYGANGHIYKPDYKEKGIIETYTKKGEQSCNDRLIMTAKIAYKLSKFTKNSFSAVYIPSSLVNWCKTNFKHDKNEVILDKIYLRHYITKSFEEYVQKVYIRGMFSKNRHRNLDDFFSVNPDMLDKKEELLKLANEIICQNQSQ